MEDLEKRMTALEQDLEEKLIATKNPELIESYVKFKTALYEIMQNISSLL